LFEFEELIALRDSACKAAQVVEVALLALSDEEVKETPTVPRRPTDELVAGDEGH